MKKIHKKYATKVQLGATYYMWEGSGVFQEF